ncbi:galactosyltransferase isoform 1 [Galdieria sulphuraria]|uniref:Hexosyltransferase n=1 Tax=Galdieria sulphuraria TaxID=130081 RepID=M2W7U8_GALSU|nr:galactosyltransferase isoform 1 [Galdieria sulphuraria]EME31896.1 galactosyltransferase isoform 1 [Galdieria sulphuraria]|eukprot:XP_005708416.1 galactosyltransferase isoform 1 [Galdieria sulphuraria]
MRHWHYSIWVILVLLLWNISLLSRPKKFIFIAIGSAPENRNRRDACRRSWLSWRCPTVAYRFFTELNTANREQSVSLNVERQTLRDIEFQPFPQGRQVMQGARFLYQAAWALGHYEFDFYLKTDDDVLLCIQKLQHLLSEKRNKFFWGKYWCKQDRSYPDESFLLFSTDLLRFLVKNREFLLFDEEVSMAWNFGFLSRFLNISIFDDRTCIDSQQGYLTYFMHQPGFNFTRQISSDLSFCDKYLFSHHVESTIDMRIFKESSIIPPSHRIMIQHPRDTCGTNYSIIPCRKSRIFDLLLDS